MIEARVTPSVVNELPIALDKFIEVVGITDTTAWRWRQKGWLQTANICGRLYITPEAVREFNRRMLAGEFAKKHVAPNKKKLPPEDDSFRERIAA